MSTLCHVDYGTDGRKTVYRSENMNSNRQLNDECEGGTLGVEGIVGDWCRGRAGKWRLLEEILFLSRNFL